MNKTFAYLTTLSRAKTLIKSTQMEKAFLDQTKKILQSPNKTNSQIRGYFLEIFLKVLHSNPGEEQA